MAESDAQFDWDGHNRAHIAEHGVRPEEAEQVIANDPLDIQIPSDSQEQRTVSLGETDAGRILVVVTTWRGDRIRVVTAYPAARRLRQFYMHERGHKL